ncbi:MAG: TraR/DksA family transcriptional regulator [Gemmatimonadetes bacterium]|nr:TraR/DksA family transcriptional regulator [Gemmatimonadota bacterium]
MSHLTPDQLAELRSVLERDLEKLERSMRVTDEAMRPVELDQSAVGRLSRMDSLQNQGLTRNLQEREQVKLALIVGALRRMEESRYGTCTECDAPVPFERLLVFPEAPTCAACTS